MQTSLVAIVVAGGMGVTGAALPAAKSHDALNDLLQRDEIQADMPVGDLDHRLLYIGGLLEDVSATAHAVYFTATRVPDMDILYLRDALQAQTDSAWMRAMCSLDDDHEE
jgi:hypothetical protein